MAETEQEDWAWSVNSLHVENKEVRKRKKDSKILIQADELKDCDQERNIELLLPHDLLIFTSLWFLMIVGLQYFLEADRPGTVT